VSVVRLVKLGEFSLVSWDKRVEILCLKNLLIFIFIFIHFWGDGRG